MVQPFLLTTARWRITAAVITLLNLHLSSLTIHAALPPNPPKGVSVLNSNGRALRTGILSNHSVDMISLLPDWNSLESTEGMYDWTDYLDNDLNTIYPYGKAVLLRINTMGGCAPTGNTPPWVFKAMGQADCTCDVNGCTITPGVTYSFFDNKDQIWRLIPVFWNPAYLAKKKALIAMAGAHISASTQFSSQVQVVVISYANGITEDWNVPHDDSSPPPTEVDLWLEVPPDGAGYTTKKMIDAAIHQGDATFSDGVISGTGTTLISASAVFTQADVAHQIRGRGFGRGTTITAWVSPHQVTLSQRARRNANTFTIVGRRDGLIDVAMAAFPNQYITTAVGSNGPKLDACAAGPNGDPGTYLAKTVDNMVWTVYGNRYIVQRNNVSAIIPTRDVATDAWVILANATNLGRPTAGQALSNCYPDTTYQMNGGTNCNLEDPNCVSTPTPTPCIGSCVITFQQELDQSGEHLATYCANYYEAYYFDAANLSLDYLHGLFTGTACQTPTPTPTATPTTTPTPTPTCSS